MGRKHWQVTLQSGCIRLLSHKHHRREPISLNACHHLQTLRGWPTRWANTVSHCCFILPHGGLNVGGQLCCCYSCPHFALCLAPCWRGRHNLSRWQWQTWLGVHQLSSSGHTVRLHFQTSLQLDAVLLLCSRHENLSMVMCPTSQLAYKTFPCATFHAVFLCTGLMHVSIVSLEATCRIWQNYKRKDAWVLK